MREAGIAALRNANARLAAALAASADPLSVTLASLIRG